MAINDNSKAIFRDWIDDGNLAGIQNEKLSSLYEKNFLKWFSLYRGGDVDHQLDKNTFIAISKDFLKAKGLTNINFKNSTDLLDQERAERENTISESLKDYLDISTNEKFEMIETHACMIADGYVNSLFIHGDSGIGKSHTILEALKTKGIDFKVFSGGLRGTFELVKILYMYKDDEILIFDDFDSALKTKEQLNILKTALHDDDVRTITYLNEQKRKQHEIPSQFDFTSGIIFISNLSRIPASIKSRSMCLELKLSNREMLERIRQNLTGFMPKVPIALKKEVIDFIEASLSKIKRIDFRQFKFAVANRIAKPENNIWKKWILANLNS